MGDQLGLVCAGRNKRPEKTKDMRLHAAERLVQRMVESGALDGEDTEGCAADIVEATRFEIHDGYRIARELDQRFHWDCDMEIAEQLNEFSGILDDIFREAERKWAAENPREPKFSDGDSVLWRGKPATVHGVCEYYPQYYKIRQGDMKSPGSFYIVPFEDVSAAGGEG